MENVLSKAQENDRKERQHSNKQRIQYNTSMPTRRNKNRNKWEHYLKYAILLFKNSKFTQRIML